jgi:23S rRNA G2069 N7-methylase RlmK/C1962 C5-methylase RlmI
MATTAMAMRLLDDEALLLEVSDLQEGDRIVSFLTRHHGRKRGAARGARRRVQVLRTTGPGPDHPVMTDHPESSYLKCMWTHVW